MNGHRCPTTAVLIVVSYVALIVTLSLIVEVFGK